MTRSRFVVAAALPILVAWSAACGPSVRRTPPSGEPVPGDVSAARGQSSQPSSPPALEGTSWQLVTFQGGDDTTLTPDDGAKYTVEFGGDGGLTARIDCNRGRGTWTSSGPNHLELGPLALTRAQCPAGSLHDHIVKLWGHVRSYVVKDGRLFLALMADGGIDEFEPAAKTGPQGRQRGARADAPPTTAAAC
jgi:heat shock protein HslJ